MTMLSGSVRTQSPRAADREATQAGWAVSRSIACRKKAARRLGKSTDSIAQYCAGDASNPVNRTAALMAAVDHPEIIATHLEIVAMRHALIGMSVAELEAELRRILHEQEPMADARAKMAALAYDPKLPPVKRREARRVLREALADEAALQKRAAACIDLLEIKEGA